MVVRTLLVGVASVLLLIGFPATNWFYWPAVLHSGVLPADADSIGIPMFGGILLAIATSPVVLVTMWLCTRRRGRAVRLLAWRSDRPVLSVAATTLAAVPVSLSLIALTQLALTPGSRADFVWVPFLLVLLAWAILVRAAALGEIA